MALRRNVLQEDDILCELCADTRSDVSDYSDNKSLDSDSDIPTISSCKQLWSYSGPLTPQFPHPFLLTLLVGTVLNLFGRPGILVTTTSKQDSGRLFKIWSVYEYSVQKVGSVYSPKQELSLDEAMISWRGCLKLRTYNSGKITKYVELVRTVCEVVSGYT